MEKLVSVIMPLYNRADMVGESIESLLAQTYNNWELIIADSDSQDNSLAVAKEYAAKDSRVKVFSLDCRGVSFARNKCLDEAVGDYVCFLDSDDVINPKLIETLVTSMQSTGARIGGTGCRFVNNNEWSKVYEGISRSTDNKATFLKSEDAIDAMFSYTSPINIMGGVMLSRELIGDTRFNTDLHIGEDFYFVYQNLVKGADVIFLDKLWYYARVHDSNISKDYSYDGFMSRFRRRELVWKSEETFGRTENVNRQKRDALNVYRSYLIRNNPDTPDGKKICKVIKSYKKQILPALCFKDKINFHITTTFPKTYHKLVHQKSK